MIEESQKPHPVAQNATRMGHPWMVVLLEVFAEFCEAAYY